MQYMYLGRYREAYDFIKDKIRTVRSNVHGC